MAHEDKGIATANKKALEELKDKLEEKNSYIGYFVKDDVKKADEDKKKNTDFVSYIISLTFSQIVRVRPSAGEARPQGILLEDKV